MNRRKGNRAPADAWSAEELLIIHERSKRLFPDGRHGASLRMQWRNTRRTTTSSPGTSLIASTWRDWRRQYLGTLYGEDAAKTRLVDTRGASPQCFAGMWGLNGLLKKTIIAPARGWR